MNSSLAQRLALGIAVLASALASSGCPELNRWTGPSQDPFFSVADPPPGGVAAPFATDRESPQDRELSDPAR